MLRIEQLPPQTVTSFNDVLELLEGESPTLKSYVHQLRSSEALVRQASLTPNPELELEVENLGGSLSGTEESVISLELGQRIELGGKRAAREALAKANRQQVTLAQSIASRKLVNEALSAYSHVQTGQQLARIHREFLLKTERAKTIVQGKVRAGATLPLEGTKAFLEVEDAKIALEHVTLELHASKLNLAKYWSSKDYKIGSLQTPPKFKKNINNAVAFQPEKSPLYALHLEKIAQSRRKIELLKSLAIPDVTLKGGYRRLRESNDNTFIAGVSIRLPIFDRHQGEIVSAEEALKAQLLTRASLTRDLRSRYQQLQSELTHIAEERARLRDSMLPQARIAMTQARSAYELGRTSYLNLRDSKISLFKLKKRYVELELLSTTTQIALSDITGADITTSRGK